MIYIDLVELEKFPNFNFIKTWLPYSEIARPENISNLPLLFFFSVVKYFDLSLKLRFCFIGWVRVSQDYVHLVFSCFNLMFSLVLEIMLGLQIHLIPFLKYF